MMTVAELIEKLAKFDSSTEVCFWEPQYGPNSIDEVFQYPTEEWVTIK